MNRLLVLGGSLVAAAAVAALPAVIGLSGNPSFSHQLPVHVPSQARSVHLVDGSTSVSVAPAPSRTRSRVEVGDDGPHGGDGPTPQRSTSSEDRPVATSADRRSRGGDLASTSSTAHDGGSTSDGRHGGDGPGHA